MDNKNCDGSGPHKGTQVRKLPYSDSGNMILCKACYEREMAFRSSQKAIVGGEWEFPKWRNLEVYAA